MSDFRDTIQTIDLEKINKTHFKQRFVGAIILTRDNKFVLQRIVDSRPFFPAGSLTTFGGKIEVDETPEAALVRELKEELGATVNINDAIYLGAITEETTGHSELIYTYFWHDRKGTITGCYEDEIAYFDNVEVIVANSQVTDDVHWMLQECMRKNLLPTISQNRDNFIWMLDAHCDTVSHKNWFKNKMDLSEEAIHLPEEIALRITAIFGDIVPVSFPWQVTLDRLEQGHIGAIVMNVGDLDLKASRAMLEGLDVLTKTHPSRLTICKNKIEVDLAVANHKIAIIPAIEGMLMFHNELDLLHSWNNRGVTIASLTHGEGTDGTTNFMQLILGDNASQYCQFALQITPSTDSFMTTQERSNLYKNEKGLADFCKDALKEMQKLGMVCDLSHANDATFWQALELTQGKFCVTHSNCASLCPHARNITDEMMKALADVGGVMGLCFFGEFIDSKEPSLEKFAQHVVHALEVMGPDHVGIGGDYDGVGPDDFMAIAHPGLMKNLWMAFSKVGIDKTTIIKIAHENFLRLLTR